MIIAILGLPGSGKTTLGKALATRFGFKHLSAGDVARDLATRDEEVKAALDAGQLAPRDKMNAEMARIIDASKGDKLVLDGYPRYLQQLVPLSNEGFEDTVYLVMAVDEDTARERLLARGRTDDQTDQIEARFETFRTETLPMIEGLLDSERCSYVIGLTPMDQFNDAHRFLTYLDVPVAGAAVAE